MNTTGIVWVDSMRKLRDQKVQATKERTKAGLSELIATMMVVAITIASGFAVFSYVNSQAGVSAQQYGNTVTNSISSLGEQFVIVDANFTSSGNNVTIWIYNNGQINLQPIQVLIYNSSRSVYIRHNWTHVTDLNSPATCTRTASTGLQNPKLNSVNVTQGGMQKLTLSIPCPSGSQTFSSGRTYFVNVLARQGNVVVYNRQR